MRAKLMSSSFSRRKNLFFGALIFSSFNLWLQTALFREEAVVLAKKAMEQKKKS
jgi:hypothetical protein